MKHDEARPLLAPWALDLLAPEVREPVGDHIEACAVCQMEVALYDEAVSGLFAYAAKQPGALAVAALPQFDADRLETLKLNVRRALAHKDGLLPPAPLRGQPLVTAPVNASTSAAAAREESAALEAPAPPAMRRRGRWGLPGRHAPAVAAPGPAEAPEAPEEDDFATDILDLDALTRAPGPVPPPDDGPVAGPPVRDGTPVSSASALADEEAAEVERPPAPEALTPPGEPAAAAATEGAEAAAPLAEAAGVPVVVPPAPAPVSGLREDDGLESLLDIIAPREAPAHPPAAAPAQAFPPAPSEVAPAVRVPGAADRGPASPVEPASAPSPPFTAPAVVAPSPPRRRLPQPWEVFEDGYVDEDDEFSTEAALEDLFGGTQRPTSAGAAAGAAKAPAETIFIDEHGEPYILRKGVNSGWRSASILLGLLTIGLFAGLVAGFFVLLDVRNRADLLEQKQPRLALYFGFSNDEVQGTVYLQPPSYTRGLIAMDMLVSFPREKQLVLWAEGPDGVTLIRPLFRQVGSSRTYVDLTRVPRGFTRMFITEEDAPFRGREPTGREVMSVTPPFNP